MKSEIFPVPEILKLAKRRHLKFMFPGLAHIDALSTHKFISKM